MRIRQRTLVPRGVAVGAVMMGILLAAAACSSSSSSASGAGSGSASTINGAGSTFAAPMYQEWAGQYHTSHSVQVNYQAIGSGGGISEFTQGVVDFGATDAPMTSTEQAAAQAAQGSVVLHIPTIIGAVVLAYNEPGIKSLRLDGPTVANIYLGKITKWNDPAIKALNPGVALPSDAIQPVERADSSGTTYAFTSYLSEDLPDLGKPGRCEQGAELPCGHRRQRQHGRRGRGPADEGRNRLRGIRLRRPEPHPGRLDEERVRAVRGAIHGLHRSGDRGRHLPHDIDPSGLQPEQFVR